MATADLTLHRQFNVTNQRNRQKPLPSTETEVTCSGKATGKIVFFNNTNKQVTYNNAENTPVTCLKKPSLKFDVRLN